MLVHITPTLRHPFLPFTLLDIRVVELDFRLEGGKDVIARRPWPNKDLLVACRNTGKKAMLGILLDIPDTLREFTVLARWLSHDGRQSAHRISYQLLDNDFGVASECPLLWEGRWPEWAAGLSPVAIMPKFAPCVVPISQDDTFRMPTISRERLLEGTFALPGRIPPIGHAFKVINGGTG